MLDKSLVQGRIFQARTALELLDTVTNGEKEWRSAGLRHGDPV